MSHQSLFRIDHAPWAWPPIWWRRWSRADAPGDATAGLVVAVMLVPQSLAYAMLAGLPPQVGVMVSYTGSEDDARNAAMQVAAMRPTYVTRDDVPAEVVDNERRIAEATAKEEGKPEAALPKIVEGRLQGFFKESVLLEQPSVIDSKKTVGQVLSDAGTSVTAFARFEVGQG